MSLLSPEKIQFLLEQARLTPSGLMIEVGVYRGGSLEQLAQAFPNRQVIGFDTFEGIPAEYSGDDEPHTAGDFNDTSLVFVRQRLEYLPNVKLWPGLFPQSAVDMEESPRIAFAHLDMDHWRGTLAALEFIWPRMLFGGRIVFDDYDWVRCPGIAPLVNTWAVAHKASLITAANQASITR